MITTEMTFKFKDRNLEKIIDYGLVSECFIVGHGEYSEQLNNMARAYAERAIKSFLSETDLCVRVRQDGAVDAMLFNHSNYDTIHPEMTEASTSDQDCNELESLSFETIREGNSVPLFKILEKSPD